MTTSVIRNNVNKVFLDCTGVFYTGGTYVRAQKNDTRTCGPYTFGRSLRTGSVSGRCRGGWASCLRSLPPLGRRPDAVTHGHVS